MTENTDQSTGSGPKHSFLFLFYNLLKYNTKLLNAKVAIMQKPSQIKTLGLHSHIINLFKFI